MSYLANFNNESAKQILMDIIRCVNQPENSKKLSEAKASAGKEMILMMQHVNNNTIIINFIIFNGFCNIGVSLGNAAPVGGHQGSWLSRKPRGISAVLATHQGNGAGRHGNCTPAQSDPRYISATHSYKYHKRYPNLSGG